MCADKVDSMLRAIRVTAAIYAVNCVLALSGAIFAIRSRIQFSFEQISSHHSNFHSNYQTL